MFLITGDLKIFGVVYDVAIYLTGLSITTFYRGFYFAKDANSYLSKPDIEKNEGKYYVWSLKASYAILGDCNSNIYARFYGVTADCNMARENNLYNEFLSQNVLSIKITPSALVKKFGIAESEITKILKAGQRKFWQYRKSKRPQPAINDKIIVA